MAQMHCNRKLDLCDLRLSPGHTTTRVVRVKEPAKHVKVVFHDSVNSLAHPGRKKLEWKVKPVIQLKKQRAGWRSPLKPDVSGGPGKQGSQLGVSLNLSHHTRWGGPGESSVSESIRLRFNAAINTSSS